MANHLKKLFTVGRVKVLWDLETVSRVAVTQWDSSTSFISQWISSQNQNEWWYTLSRHGCTMYIHVSCPVSTHGSGYLVGQFPSGGPEPRWAEWNGKFRDCVRGFIKGDPGMKGQFATRICGSPDLYEPDGRGPCHSINFITAHDGFTLRDFDKSKHDGMGLDEEWGL